MPKKCKVCCGEKYRELPNDKLECIFCGTVYTKNEIEDTVSDEQKSIELINKIGKAVCEIVWRLDDCIFQGTGWYIGNGNVITNAHVVLDPEGYIGHKFNCKFTYLGKDKVFIGEAEKVDKLNDVAIVKINEDEELKKYAIKLCDNPEYVIGQTVYTIGNTVGRGLSPQKGMISRLDDMEFSESWKKKNAVPLLRTTLNIDHGNSGGPLINSKGEAIGLMSSGHVQESQVEIYSQDGKMNNVMGYGSTKVDELSIAVRLICVKNLLASNEIYKDKPRPEKKETEKAIGDLKQFINVLQVGTLPEMFKSNPEMFVDILSHPDQFEKFINDFSIYAKCGYKYDDNDFIIQLSSNRKVIIILYPNFPVETETILVSLFSLATHTSYGVLADSTLVKIDNLKLYGIKKINIDNIDNEIADL